MWYARDYNIERPDRDYPGYEDYFDSGLDPETEEEVYFEDDDLDEF